MFQKKDNQTGRANAGTPATPVPASTAIPQARRDVQPGGRPATPQERRMTVGPGIGLKGEITNCDILVVEGAVEATLECKKLEVVGGGKFDGEASVESADIHGNYDGKLTVSDLMRIHETGRVSGRARYGKIEIQSGGELSGDIASTAFEAAAEKPTPKVVVNEAS